MSVKLTPVLSPVRDLGEFIREQREAAQISLRGLAAKAGVSNPYLSQVERGLRRPSADILAQIAQGLSISVETLLIKAGVLPAGETPTVVAAIRADTGLSERHKSALVDIYLAFRNESGGAADPDQPRSDRAEPDQSGSDGADAEAEPTEQTSKTGTAPVSGEE